jgi:hypothetical protein
VSHFNDLIKFREKLLTYKDHTEDTITECNRQILDEYEQQSPVIKARGKRVVDEIKRLMEA